MKNIKRQNAEWDKINELNRNIREQVRLEREQKALAKKKQEAEARELEEKIKTDLQNFINLIDKGKVSNDELIDIVDDLEECEDWKDSNKLQYGRNIKFRLDDLGVTLNVKSAFRETVAVNEILNTNEKLFKRISEHLENLEKTKSNTKVKNKIVTEEIEIKKEDKGFEYE